MIALFHSLSPAFQMVVELGITGMFFMGMAVVNPQPEPNRRA